MVLGWGSDLSTSNGVMNTSTVISNEIEDDEEEIEDEDEITAKVEEYKILHPEIPYGHIVDFINNGKPFFFSAKMISDED